MNVLDEIIVQKKKELSLAKARVSEMKLKRSELFDRNTYSLAAFLLNPEKNGIIAEFKRRSPSKGLINSIANVAETTKAYTLWGASGLSILTDANYFGGSAADLVKARVNPIPILRKDFIIDEYQLTEAKAMGADVILLIAACLSPQRVQELASFAKGLQLETVLEIHTENELEHICAETGIVGVNNRDLKTFETDIGRSLELSKKIPADKLRIAESGIDSPETIKKFREAGFRGFLIGEHFMKETDPGAAFKKFTEALKNI